MDILDTPSSPPKSEVQALIRTVQIPAIQKAVLQSICAVNGLTKTGNKSDLQRRIMQLINECANTGDAQRFYEIQASVHKQAGISVPALANVQAVNKPLPPPTTSTQYYLPPTPRVPTTPSYATMSPYSSGSSYTLPTNGHRPSGSFQSSPFQYKTSPFYEIVHRVGEIKTLSPQHRYSVTVQFKAMDSLFLQQCVEYPNYRVMVFCAGGNTGVQDIAFPYESGLKVNSGDLKANLRGLKNKPGSTRPVDITDSLRLRLTGYVNTVEFTYASTQKVNSVSLNEQKAHDEFKLLKFYFGVYVCKIFPVEELVKRINKKIRKDSVIVEIAKKANDPDVIATSQNISLKCPLSYMRLKHPVRSFGCSHIQCFDATSYLQLQEQGPQWICPICNKPAPYDQLAVDEYVMEIIQGTSDSVEQVTIEPDGKWAVPGPPAKKLKAEPQETSLNLEDDFYISEMFRTPTHHTPSGTRAPVPPAPAYMGTPSNGTSRDSSTMPRSSISNKRPASEVIDLTLSSDEDEPPRPIKRTNYGSNGPSYSGSY
ncbi:PINIT domain-containing protein [Apodospora peruviana]|uniref:PINIT domain-containing protein n=1 Tax=Apodospora peruviana TaxID=516989 RepID=A0AAE0LZJ7_9PEZI|nr:PINIT domain-containing protein [Apodospora peruviana]